MSFYCAVDCSRSSASTVRFKVRWWSGGEAAVFIARRGKSSFRERGMLYGSPRALKASGRLVVYSALDSALKSDTAHSP